MKFTLKKTDPQSQARAGVIETDHGIIETPIFMPVGTAGTVKGVHQHEIENDIKAHIILGNTYHLYLRPKMDVIEAAGGLHKFMNWEKPILTDSGGFQVYSLSGRRKITEEGVRFKSHIDGSYHFFSPEYAMDVQRTIGADIIMAFDECTPYPCDYHYAKRSMKMTHRWLKRCCEHFDSTPDKYGFKQTLFPIVQGSTYTDLRKESAEAIASFGREGNAIGGLSVGEPADEMYAMTEIVTAVLPKDKPRYLMGVGTPADILGAVKRGVDMFDCVMPTRSGRTGLAFTWKGRINIKNNKFKNDNEPLDPNCSNLNLNRYSKNYLNHLFNTNEILGSTLLTLHNINFYQELMSSIRENIKKGTFDKFHDEYIDKL
jgi:queuine tRNA-ribosyltransferase